MKAQAYREIPSSRWQPRKRRYPGFTLIELLVVLAVAAILAAMAGPSLSLMVKNQRGKGAATDLYLALVKARSEAIKRNTSVTLTQATGGWQAGWTIPDPSGATNPIESHNSIGSVSITGPSSVTYYSSGRVIASTPPAFDVSPTGSSTHWCIKVDLSGRPYTTTGTSCT